MSWLTFGEDFECIAPVDGVEQGLQDVVAVLGTTLADKKANVNLGIGESDFFIFHVFAFVGAKVGSFADYSKFWVDKMALFPRCMCVA